MIVTPTHLITFLIFSTSKTLWIISVRISQGFQKVDKRQKDNVYRPTYLSPVFWITLLLSSFWYAGAFNIYKKKNQHWWLDITLLIVSNKMENRLLHNHGRPMRWTHGKYLLNYHNALVCEVLSTHNLQIVTDRLLTV